MPKKRQESLDNQLKGEMFPGEKKSKSLETLAREEAGLSSSKRQKWDDLNSKN